MLERLDYLGDEDENRIRKAVEAAGIRFAETTSRVDTSDQSTGGVASGQDPTSFTSCPMPHPVMRKAFNPHNIAVFMQPIMEFSSGRITGFEALARLQNGDALLAPAQFLSDFSHVDRVGLFCTMLSQAANFIRCARKGHPAQFVSVNVETSILMREDILELIDGLDLSDVADAICLELLETEQIEDFERAFTILTRLKERNFRISLDDAGSAYSSLIMLKRLPFDVIKLDQVFARELHRSPADLEVVRGMVSLARGLGKKLVVEGIETPEIQNAVYLLGVEYGQGYAIAKPMPVENALKWLDNYREVIQERFPSSLLGCYSVHLNVVETIRMLALQSLTMRWQNEISNPHTCKIRSYFDRHDLNDTLYGQAYREFQAVIDTYYSSQVGWEQAASRLRCELQTAIVAGEHNGCSKSMERKRGGAGASGTSLSMLTLGKSPQRR